jgi:ABC-type glycerol-3-phosphate transport system substrate-binding protein
MQPERSLFQTVLMFVFGFAAIAAVGMFALTQVDTSGDIAPVVIWGDMPEELFNSTIRVIADEEGDAGKLFKKVSYRQVDKDRYIQDTINGLASGQGPDLFLMRSDTLTHFANKVQPITNESISRNAYQATFLDAADVFLYKGGTYAVPFLVDPLVMYWNKDLLGSAAVPKPPQYWGEVFPLVQKLTIRNETGQLTQSTIAFGAYENVPHAKDILAMLVMQAGGQVTQRTSQSLLSSTLASSGADDTSPAQNAVRFYTSFADPSKIDVYTWNNAQPDARDRFIEGKLALYIGYGSESDAIRIQNPNLNFAMASVPQTRGGGRVVTGAHVYGFGIPLTARNVNGAVQVSFRLSNNKESDTFAKALGFASARRDVAAIEADGDAGVRKSAAVQARTWVDPEPEKTDLAFKQLINDVINGTKRIGESVTFVDQRIADIIRTDFKEPLLEQ